MQNYEKFPNWSTGFYERQIPKLLGISKAVRLESGDGWKDRGIVGDITFIYGREMRAPYGAGQFMKVGNPISSVSAGQTRFEKPTLIEIWNLRKKIYQDLRYNWGRLKLMFGPHHSFDHSLD